MNIKLILGRKNSGKTTLMLNEIKNSDGDVIYIVPEQNVFFYEKLVLNTLSEEKAFLMETLSFKKLSDCALRQRKDYSELNFADDDTKNLLLSKIIHRLKNQLTVFGRGVNKPEFTLELSAQISELKKYLIDSGKIFETLEKGGLPEQLGNKLKDIALILEAYEKETSEILRDYDELLTMAAKEIREKNLFAGKKIYIDGFTGFTAQELNIIKALLDNNCSVTVSLLLDPVDCEAPGDLFYSSGVTLKKLMKLCENAEIRVLEKSFFPNREFEFLEKNFYSDTVSEYPDKCSRISAVRAENPYEEVKQALVCMLGLIKNNRLKYKDFAFAVPDLAGYKNDIETLFEEYNISYYINEKTPVSDISAAGFVNLIAEILRYPGNRGSFFNYLKSGYVLKEHRDEIFMFENFVRTAGVRVTELFSDRTIDEIIESKAKYGFKIPDTEALKFVYDNAVLPLKKLVKKSRKSRNAMDTGRLLVEFLEEIGYRNSISEYAEKFSRENDMALAMQLVQVYNNITGAIKRISLIMDGEEIDADFFCRMLKTACDNHNIATIPLSMDSVMVTDIAGVCNGEFKYVFMLGMSDGALDSNSKEALINETDREYLNDAGITLSMSRELRLSEERLLLYSAVCSAKEGIFFSYPSVDSALDSCSPSSLILDLTGIFPSLSLEEAKRGGAVTTKRLLFEYALEELKYNRTSEENINRYKYFLNDPEYSGIAHRVLKNLNSGSIGQRVELSPRAVEGIIGNTLKTAVTGLENYRSCGFSYYMKYILKCRERKDFTLAPTHTGSLIHRVLCEFSKRVAEDKIGYGDITEEYISAVLGEITDAVLKEEANGIFEWSARNRYVAKKLKRISKRSVRLLKEHFEQGEFVPYGYEMTFSKEGGDLKGITLKLPEGRRVEFRGIIDRVDKLEASDGSYIRIVDYKSSDKKLEFDEIYNGISLQLAFYLLTVLRQDTAETLKPGGMLYLTLDEPIISAANPTDPEIIELEIKNKLKMRGIVINDIEIINKMDKDFEDNKVSSYIDKLKLDKNNCINQTNTLSENEFFMLMNHVEKTVQKISERIMNGEFDIMPLLNGNRSGCDYCPYGAVCGFDEKSCSYSTFEHMDKKTVMESISDEQS